MLVNMKLKRLFSSLLAASIALSMVGCSGKTNSPTSTTPAPTNNSGSQTGGGLTKQTAMGGAYANLDTSKPVTIHWYALGDVPPDLEVVLNEVNSKYLQPVLNATLKVEFMGWSDYSTKYPLVLAGGEEADLIYTAAWCFFQQEGQKGAFKELTDDFLKTYMPMTWKNQAPASWDQVKLGGKKYAVTRNMLPLPNYKFLAVREDLREKYNLEPIKDLASFEKYLLTVAEKEKGIQALASAGNNGELRDILALQNNKVYSISGANYDYVYKDTNGLAAPPKPEEVEYLYTSSYYKDFIDRMKVWAEKGVWSKNAINNSVSTADAYGQGKSAALPWVDAVFGYGKMVEDAKLGKADYVDITNHIVPRQTIYSGDAMAIPRSSKNPERAAMVLDFIKNDKDLNLLIMGGIQGKHWILEADGTRSNGPDADKFGWDSFAWGVRNEWIPKEKNRDPRELKIVDSLKSREKAVPIDGFTFDETSVKNEIAVINSLRDEYTPSFELGAFGANTDAKFNEFKSKMESAGLAKVMNEFKKQYGDYLAAKK
jgi:ABC-type glycerol-3-phosphate transport system substrate-binding protein